MHEQTEGKSPSALSRVKAQALGMRSMARSLKRFRASFNYVC